MSRPPVIVDTPPPQPLGGVEALLEGARERTLRLVAGVSGADLADLELTFADGEEIRTEISAKFTRDAVERELHDAGLALDDFFTDGAGLFGLAFASPR